MSPIIVTGAGGFVAGSLVSVLAGRGHDVVAVLRPGGSVPSHDGDESIRHEHCDLSDQGAIRSLIYRYRPAAIINLAVSRSTQLEEARRVNSAGVASLIDAAAAIDAHLVHIGSSLEYGSHDSVLGPATLCQPTSALGITKLEASRSIGLAVRETRLRACVLRPFHVYGRGEPSQRLVPSALRAAITGDPLPLTAPGSGHDLIHVDDVNSAVVAALEVGLVRADAIDVCTGRGILNEEVVGVIELETGRKIVRQVGAFAARDWDRAVWVGDPAELTALLGRAPASLEEGIRSVVRQSTLEGRS